MYIQHLCLLRCGYAAASTEATAEDDDVLQHSDLNGAYHEETIGRIKHLTVLSKASHESGDLLELDGWKNLDTCETSPETFDAWREPKDWRIEQELGIEEDGCESAWSATDA
ncbi:hypothetical protein F4678DRAFT_305028 [Xylaria arbuscula]|nr:hypothetical protein F4678DRAFT_305028 [Xylaria arbuscula]